MKDSTNKNSTIKNIIVIVMIILILVVVKNINKIKSIDMTVYINNSGDAKVTEIWNTYPTEGTEYYHSYYNLGNSTIKNLKVSDESGKYETLLSWNPNNTFDFKKNKCGLNYVSEGIEVCWGKSNLRKNKTYTVEYEITNFVKNLTDAQMAYWTLIPEGHDKFGRINIEIKSDFSYEDTIEVKGYGNFGGQCELSDGIIKMNSKGKSFPSDNYMVILIKFPSETFNTNNIENKNYEHYLNMEEEAAIHYKENKIKKIISISVIGIIIIASLVVCFMNFDVLKSSKNKKTISSIISLFVFCLLIRMGYGKFLVYFCIISIIINLIINYLINLKEKIKIKKAEYYRDIPCQKDIFRAYYISLKNGLTKNKTDFFGALLLKWLKEGKISIKKYVVEEKNKKKEEIYIQPNLPYDKINNLTFNQEHEEILYKYIKEIADLDWRRAFKKSDFYDWCTSNYTKISKWFEDVIKSEEKILIVSGEITKKEFATFKKLVYGDELFNDVLQLAGLKKYLKNYTLIHEKEAIEVELFEDYLIYAQMFGIAKKVMKEFKDLYPDEITQSNFESFSDIDSLNTFASGAMGQVYGSDGGSSGGGSSGGSSGGGGRNGK